MTVALLTGVAGALLSFSLASTGEVETSRSQMRALYMAESGVSEALAAMATTLKTGDAIPENLGTTDAPEHMATGEYWVDIESNGDDTFTVRSTGRVERSLRGVEVLVEHKSGGIFDHALFAGNSSGDPTYTLKLGGVGGQADLIEGNVYSGNDVSIEGEATVDGSIQATGSINGGDGDTDVTQPIPDIAGMDYGNNNDFDVAALFNNGTARWVTDDAGGRAWQMPEDNPAHIFRKNPNDRGSENASTQKDDFYLEDPYEPVTRDTAQTGYDPYLITLSGAQGTPGPDGNNAVYYIDGNLWIHNNPTYSFKFFDASGAPIRVTFVVRGNIMFSDNVFYQDPENDGLAFIAIKDENVADSGNIYFGDPRGGTLVTMYGYMYAENDFYDYNLEADGSTTVSVFGNMTAGNHVSIDRDYTKNGQPQHSRLAVHMDDRIARGELPLPGLPDSGGENGFTVLTWREVTVQP